MSKVIAVNEQNFDEEVLSEKGKVLVDFYSDTCAPCQMMSPILEQLAEELTNSVKIAKINASENYALVEKYEVNSVPTFVVLEDGETIKTKTGIMPPSQLKSWLGVTN